MAPNGTDPDVITDTVEGCSDKEAEKLEPPKPVQKTPSVERVKVQKRGGNKAVLNDESKTN